MICRLCVVAALLLGLSLASSPAIALTILAPGDPIIAIDSDPGWSNSSVPGSGNESADKAIDGTLSKYLNFGKEGAGFIVTPGGSTNVLSFRLTTANDSEPRDPASYELYGTLDAITSPEHSIGLNENWTLISSGGLSLPAGRNAVGPLVSFANPNSYTSYRMIYPTVKNAGSANSMQMAEVEYFQTSDGSGLDILDLGDPIIAIDFNSPDSRTPGAEGVEKLIDHLTMDPGSTKYLNFGKLNSGFIVTPASGPSVLKTFQMTTANDAESRDPASWVLYGTNAAITSGPHSQGTGEAWTLIASGAVDLPLLRNTSGPYVPVSNNTAYTSYKMLFPSIRNAAAGDADSLQLNEIQFYDVTIPEPSSLAFTAIAVTLAAAFARKNKR